MSATNSWTPTRPTISWVRRPPRNRELLLLLLALTVIGLAFTALRLNHDPSSSSPAVQPLALFAVLVLIAHMAVRGWAPRSDPVLLPIVTVLSGLGLVMIQRLDLRAMTSVRLPGRHAARVDSGLQVVWILLGVLLLGALLWTCKEHTRLARYPFLAAAAGLALLLMPVLPVLGTTINGARLWLRIGPFTVQPAEFAKLVLVVFFAAYLASRRNVLSLAGRRRWGLDVPRGRDAAPLLLAWLGSLAVLTAEHDLGLSALFFGVFVAMLYISTERGMWVLGAGILAAVGLVVSFFLVHNVHNRIEVWLHPMRDPLGANYQPLQAKYGLGTGGLTGTGLGQGSPGLVPFAKTDFMVSSLGEELGLVGVMAILVLFAVFVSRGLSIALRCLDDFGTLLAGGLAVVLGLQVFFIVGGVTGLIPLTGVTLPWMSYGGSSVLSNWALLALLLRISDTTNTTAPKPAQPSELRSALAEALTQAIRLR